MTSHDTCRHICARLGVGSLHANDEHICRMCVGMWTRDGLLVGMRMQMGGAQGVRDNEVYFVTIQPKERLNMRVIPRLAAHAGDAGPRAGQ